MRASATSVAIHDKEIMPFANFSSRRRRRRGPQGRDHPVPTTSCYLSTAPVEGNGYTFYGYGNGDKIPNGDAGWRIEAAPDPKNCSVQYSYNGTGVPVVKVNNSGC